MVIAIKTTSASLYSILTYPASLYSILTYQIKIKFPLPHLGHYIFKNFPIPSSPILIPTPHSIRPSKVD